MNIRCVQKACVEINEVIHIAGDGRLEIVLFKEVEGEKWETLFVGDGLVGEEVTEHNSDVTKRLTHLTSDQWVSWLCVCVKEREV